MYFNIKETGVANAIQAIYRDLEYAKTLIKNRTTTAENDQMGDEESWTFIGDESDPEVVKLLAEWGPTTPIGREDTPNRALVGGAAGEVNLMEKDG